MSGFVLLSRSIQDNSLWRKDSEHLRMFLWLVMNANYSKEKTYKYGDVEVGYGQFLTSYRRIANENEYVSNNQLVRWSPTRIRRMLQVLISDGRISTKKTRLGTLVTVENYQEYQQFSTYSKKGLSGGTSNIKQSNHSKEEHAPELWALWIEEFGGKPPLPRLTEKRKRCLELLYSEQLENQEDPLALFKKILKAVRASEHHMKERPWHSVDSLFRSVERREQWTHKALARAKANPSTHAVSREWSIEA